MVCNYILLIQSLIRGNKVRNKINNIYLLLPDDIQRIIIKNIRKNYNNLNKIIYKKIINVVQIGGYLDLLIDFTNYKLYRDLNVIFRHDIINFNNYMQKLHNVFYLINKYSSVLKFNEYEYTKLYKLSYNYNCQDFNYNLYNEIMNYKLIYKKNII